MSKTALVWLIIYISGLVSSFWKGPILALLTYIFTYYTLFSWGKSVAGRGQFRASFIAAVVLIIVYFVKKNKLHEAKSFNIPQLKWLILICINMLLVSPFAADVGAHYEVLFEFFKIAGIYCLIIYVLQNKKYYKSFTWLLLWGNFLLGWHGYTRGDMVGGRLENIGAPGIQTSNHLAAHLVMILPFIGVFILFGNKWERIAAIVAAPFVVNALILCNSRGAFIAIAVMVISFFILSPKGARMKIVLLLSLAIVGFVQLADERVWSRLQTVQTYEEDGSAMGRVASWRAALLMIADYPFGQGGDGWKTLSPIYIPEIVEAHGGQKRAIHNSVLQIFTSWGIQGGVLYFIFFALTFNMLRGVRKRGDPGNSTFFTTQSLAIEVSIIGFLVAGIFGSYAYAESLYWYCALAVVLNNLQLSENMPDV